MIGFLKGRVFDAGKDAVIIETGGGVGYLVTTSSGTKADILSRKECVLYTHTAVRKDTIDLFGFVDQEEYSVFLLLMSVSGVGPKKALAILDAMPAPTLLSAIKKEDVETLVSFGVGRKQAQRMVLDLHKKIEVTEDDLGVSDDAFIALVALGYDKKEVLEAVRGASLSGMTVAEQVQESLKLMRSASVGG